MRKLALLAALSAVLLAHTGCARWTLRPMHGKRAGDAQPLPEKMGALSSLMRSQASSGSGDAAQDPTTERSPEQGLDKIPSELALARLNERQGDEHKAEALYREYIAKHPEHPLSYHRLGVMAARKSKLDDAEQHLRKALEVAPPSVELLGDMGYLCYLQSRFDEAEHYLLQALEQAPDNKSATNNLAIVYGARGDFDKSLRYFNRVSDDAKSHANVAFTMTQQGRLEDARNEYLTALSIDKSLRSAANALVQIETKRKAAQAAAKRSGRQPAAAEGNDGALELSSTRAESAPAADRGREVASPAAQFEPVARNRPTNVEAVPAARTSPASLPIENRSVASNGPSSRPAAVYDERLMPLPALPTGDFAPPPASADSLAARGNLAPLPAFGNDESVNVEPTRFSRFSPDATTAAAQAIATAPASQSGDRAEEIFSQARQVSWNAESPANAGTPFRGKSEAIGIPTFDTTSMRDVANTNQPFSPDGAASKVQPALAVESVAPAASAVRPAVHLGLSDAKSPEPTTPVTASVKSQFSDFGSAPARINVSSTTAPLSSRK